MEDATTAVRMRCAWVQVTDAQGRTRMEARWSAEPSRARVQHAA